MKALLNALPANTATASVTALVVLTLLGSFASELFGQLLLWGLGLAILNDILRTFAKKS